MYWYYDATNVLPFSCKSYLIHIKQDYKILLVIVCNVKWHTSMNFGPFPCTLEAGLCKRPLSGDGEVEFGRSALVEVSEVAEPLATTAVPFGKRTLSGLPVPEPVLASAPLDSVTVSFATGTGVDGVLGVEQARATAGGRGLPVYWTTTSSFISSSGIDASFAIWLSFSSTSTCASYRIMEIFGTSEGKSGKT